MSIRAGWALACLFWADQVRADAVVLYEQADLRPSLCSALRIQLTGLADVRCRPDLAGGPAERVAAASRALRGDEQLAVLLEADVHHARMLIVGDQPDRALLAIEPIEARSEPDVDRALALKVRETLELSRTRPVVTVRRSSGALLELGGAVSTGTHTRGLGQLAFGVRRAFPRGFGELVLMGRLASALEQARVTEREWGLGVGARFGFTHGRLSAGPALDVGLVRAAAHGESEDGREGDARRVFPRLALALDLRVALGWSVALRFAPALELDPVAQRFTVERQALELQHVRLVLPVSLAIGIGT